MKLLLLLACMAMAGRVVFHLPWIAAAQGREQRLVKGVIQLQPNNTLSIIV